MKLSRYPFGSSLGPSGGTGAGLVPVAPRSFLVDSTLADRLIDDDLYTDAVFAQAGAVPITGTDANLNLSAAAYTIAADAGAVGVTGTNATLTLAGGTGTTILTVTTFPQTFSTGTWPLSALNTGKWHLRWTPAAANTDAAWGNTNNFYALVVANDSGGLWIHNDALELYGQPAGGTLVFSRPLTWSAAAQIDITIDNAAGTYTVAGATTGNGTFSFTPTNDYYTNTTLGVGIYGGGGFSLPASTISSIDDATPLSNYTIAADSGAVPVTGTAANLLRTFVLAAAAGVVGIAGTDATLSQTTNAYTIAADSGAVPISGTAAGTVLASRVAADSGAVPITGTAATLQRTYALAAASGSIPVTGTAATLSYVGGLSLGGHGIGVQINGHGINPTTVALDTVSGSMLVVASGGNSNGSNVGGTVTDNRSNTFVKLDGVHDYPDYPGYGTAISTAASISGGAAHEVYQPCALFDESTCIVAEVRGGNRVSAFTWSQHANAGAASTQSTASITTTGPAILLAYWWGSGPVGQNHTAVPNGTFSVIESYLLNNNDGYVQAALAYDVKSSPGSYSVTWTHTPTQGAQLWLLAIEGPLVLDAQGGTVPVTGSVATLRYATSIAAASGAVAIAGTDAALLRTYALAAASGSVPVTGTDATLQRTYALTAASGDVPITGSAATLGLTIRIAADAGAVPVTGTTANLTRTYALTADPGSVAVTGSAATLGLTIRLDAQAGSVPVAGSDAGLGRTYALAAASGAVPITGTAATLGGVLSAASGSVPITGAAAALTLATRIAADAGVVPITGTAAALVRAYTLSAQAGSVPITGADAALVRTYALSAQAGTVSVTGTAAALVYGARVVADPGAVPVTGTAAALGYTRQIDAEPGALAVAGTDATLRYARRLAADPGSVPVSGADAALGYARRLAADPGSVPVSGADAALVFDNRSTYQLDSEPGAVPITGTAATLGRTWSLSAAAGAVALVGRAVALRLGVALDPPAVGGAILRPNPETAALVRTNYVTGAVVAPYPPEEDA